MIGSKFTRLLYLFLCQIRIVPGILIKIPQSSIPGETAIDMKPGVHD